MTVVLQSPAASQATQAQSAQGLYVKGLCKSFGAQPVLEGVSFHAEPGEIVAVAGPSGTGKTTLGRLISGLELADQGQIALAGRDLLALPVQKRHVAHMFESFALYPTLSAFDNIASPLRSPACREKPDAQAIEQRVMELLELTEIPHLAQRRPSDMSGGQKQRVALCRTLVQRPDVFILDEPIGHLDAKLRHTLRSAIRQRQQALAQPTLWFTPDVVEAMAVADRVVMLVDGRVRQIGHATDLTLTPADMDVARLTGDPAMNLLQVKKQQGQWWVQGAAPGEPPSRLPAWLSERLAALQLSQAHLGFLPARTEVVPVAADHEAALAQAGAIAARIYGIEPFGKYTLLTLQVGTQRIRAKVAPQQSWQLEQAVSVQWPREGLCLFDSDSGQLLSSLAHDQ